MAYNRAGAWEKPVPIHYAGDDANGSSDDNDARLETDRHTLYFSSDRAVPVHFPRTPEQARQDYDRLQSWDNGNSNVWFVALTFS
jgi:hypothetical protein